MKLLKITGVVAMLAFSSAVALADKAPAAGKAAKADKAAPKDDAKPAPMAAPKPAPELEKLKTWPGTWRCKGTMTEDGKALTYNATIKITAALDNNWFNAVYSRPKTKGFDHAFVGNAWIGWDSVAKSYIFVGFDNLGGMLNLHAPDALAWTGDAMMMGQKAPATYTFTSADPKHLTTVMNIGGKEMGKDECTK